MELLIIVPIIIVKLIIEAIQEDKATKYALNIACRNARIAREREQMKKDAEARK